MKRIITKSSTPNPASTIFYTSSTLTRVGNLHEITMDGRGVKIQIKKLSHLNRWKIQTAKNIRFDRAAPVARWNKPESNTKFRTEHRNAISPREISAVHFSRPGDRNKRRSAWRGTNLPEKHLGRFLDAVRRPIKRGRDEMKGGTIMPARVISLVDPPVFSGRVNCKWCSRAYLQW